jgi:hypothetical protein
MFKTNFSRKFSPIALWCLLVFGFGMGMTGLGNRNRRGPRKKLMFKFTYAHRKGECLAYHRGEKKLKDRKKFCGLFFYIS